MLVRSTKRPSKRASASTLARSMTKPSPWGVLQKTAEALVGATRASTPRLGELVVEPGYKLGARRGVLFGFLLVAADDIAPASDRRFPDRQLGLAFLGRDVGAAR